MNKKVSIILVNYNTSKDLIECIKSLQQIDYKNYEIIIVDNFSRDEDVKLVEDFIKKDDKIILIKSDVNGGFAYGNNIGINIAIENKSDYALLLNADTEVEKDFLDHLVETSERNSDAAITIGKIMYHYDKERIWYGGGEIDWNRYVGKHHHENEIDSGLCDDEREISFATGCMMLINLHLKFDKNLPMDYFMYYEDVDYSARVLDRGYKILYNPKSIIYHKVGAAGGGQESAFCLRWSNRGRRVFMEKYKNHNTAIKNLIIKNKFYISRIVKMMVFYAKGDSIKGKAVIQGTIDGIKKIKTLKGDNNGKV